MKKLIALILFPVFAYSQVWICGGGTRVFQTDTAHWSRYVYDPQWDGTKVTLFGARNEIVDFQIIIHGTAAGRDSVNVSLDTLTKGGTLIANTPGADSLQYVGNNIQLFVVHYVKIDSLEDSNEWIKGACKAGAVPNDSIWNGYVGDALIPIKAPRGSYDNGQGGGPFDIAADKIQSVWCDIYIPKTVSSGLYTGNIRIWEKGSIVQSVPVELTVKNFTLPDTTHFKAFVWLDHAAFSGNVPTWVMEDSVEMQNKTLFRRYMQFMHRHRLGAINSISYNTFADAEGYSQYVTGTGYSAENGYAGPGVGIGANFYTIGMFCLPDNGAVIGFDPDDPTTWVPAADEWQDWFVANASTTPHALYGWDEPFNENTWYDSIVVYKGDSIRYPFAWIGTLHDSISSSAGSGKDLDLLETVAHLDAEDPSKYWPDLEALGLDWYMTTGPVGIWSGYNVDTNGAAKTAADLRALGNKVGAYNDSRPDWGGIGYTAHPQTDARSAFWVFKKYDSDMWFTWGLGYGWGKWRGPDGPYDTTEAEYFNPWKNIQGQYTAMLYPGRDSVWLPGDDRKWDGPIGSIRLAMIRRGIQDYEYLWLADSSGLDTDSLLSAMVPNAFNDSAGGWSNETDYPNWEHNDSVFEDARLYLANLLAQEESPATPTKRRRLIIRMPSTE